ncbi:MAG: cellulase family glycosylhydrolase [Candidatus Delongbacteria bacterium]
MMPDTTAGICPARLTIRRPSQLDGLRNALLLLFLLAAGRLGMAQEPLHERLGFSTGSLTNQSAEHIRRTFTEAGRVGRWIRADCDWSVVERVPGTLEWEPVDRWVDIARELGLNVVMVVAYTPTWARPACLSDKLHSAPDRRHLDEWRAFCDSVATRYGRGKGIHHFEIWNEPNAQEFYSTLNKDHTCRSAATYREVLAGAAERIRARDERAQILVGGIWPKAEDNEWNRVVGSRLWLQRQYGSTPDSARAFSASFDLLGYHPYAVYEDRAGGSTGGPLSEPEALNPFLLTAELHAIMVAHGDGDKQIWATELGARTGGAHLPRVDEATQARWVGEYLNQWGRWDFAGKLFWYNIQDECPPQDPAGWCHYGVLRFDGSRKPAYHELLRWAQGR